MLMKQIIRCKTLLTKSANFCLQVKNINMISKIIFKIWFRLFWFLLIRIEILIILSLIWVDMIDILVIKIEIFHNMIWSDRIEWLQLIFSDLFVLILIMMKVDFLLEVWIDWLWLWHSCCVSSDHQRLLWNWQSWLIILRCWILKCKILLLSFVLSVTVIFLQQSFSLLIDWYRIQLKIQNMHRCLIVKTSFLL